jgi:hypothetical protein
MIDEKIYDWLMDNADAPIRYRVARELLKDEKAAKNIEGELFSHKEVQKWLVNLKNENPTGVWCYEHGSFDICLENALPKLVQLGLHGGLQPLIDAAGLYLSRAAAKDYKDWISADMFCLAGISSDEITMAMLDKLEQIHRFVQLKTYDFYINDEERDKLSGIPKNWKNSKFIKPELSRGKDFSYPFIYDILGMFRLYDLKNPAINQKINDIIDYISNDEFHSKIEDGYGILISGEKKYHGQGWDPKYPGWFDVAGYMENDNAPKLLFFAQNIIKYPSARKTKWYNDLLNYLEKYKTENDTYIFPKEWLKESSGYAVQGHHVSFGENRRKRIWLEIESTFYMQLLQHTMPNRRNTTNKYE